MGVNWDLTCYGLLVACGTCSGDLNKATNKSAGILEKIKEFFKNLKEKLERLAKQVPQTKYQLNM